MAVLSRLSSMLQQCCSPERQIRNNQKKPKTLKKMKKEDFEKHRPFAGDKKPSMLRRRVGHDYASRRIYLITMTVEGRLPLLGRLVGDADVSEGFPDAPRVELSPLGEEVRRCWMAIPDHYPSIKVLALQLMPDHLHAILFVTRQMEHHLGLAIKGFKVGCNKAYRSFLFQGSFRSAIFPCPLMPQHCCGTENPDTAPQDPAKPLVGFLFSRNYNDHILEGTGELDRWFQYLHDNPRRLAMRRKHPEFFRVRFDLTIGEQTYAAIGNRFLLDCPGKLQVQCSRSLTDEQVTVIVEQTLAKARGGAILVSPAISNGEQKVMRAVLEARLPLIFLTPWGFNVFSRPGHQYYDACAEGRFLILAPWPHENRRIPLTREMCLALNEMAAGICRH